MTYYFIGIGGIGMSGLARILLEKKEKVLGSDIARSQVIQDLEKKGATVFLGHDRRDFSSDIKVVYTSDIPLDNPEYIEAKEKGLDLLHRSECLRDLMQGFETLLVAGSHGKTTTSSLLAHVLHTAGEDPSYCIGGIVSSLGAQAGCGQSKWFVAEADESDGTFLNYTPHGAILTNIDNDHMPFWKDKDRLKLGFLEFYQRVLHKEWVFWCKDDEGLSSLPLQGVSYGFSSRADMHITGVQYLGWKTKWSFIWEGKTYADVESPLIGAHNVLNATAVMGLCLRLGIEESLIRRGIVSFLGAKRRCEKKGEVRDIVFYDDYGHHPTEIKATLTAIRHAEPTKRLVAVFQPHRFSRTKDCFEEFALAFTSVDVVVLTDIYSAGEEPIEGIDIHRLYEKFSVLQNTTCIYAPKDTLLQDVIQEIKAGDLVISIGAGDVTGLGPKVVQELSK